MSPFALEQGDDSSSRNMDMAPGLQDKKMEGDKRGMSMNDYNGDLRKVGRGGNLPYRSPGSKEAGPGDTASYYDKVLAIYHIWGLLPVC